MEAAFLVCFLAMQPRCCGQPPPEKCRPISRGVQITKVLKKTNYSLYLDQESRVQSSSSLTLAKTRIHKELWKGMPRLGWQPSREGRSAGSKTQIFSLLDIRGLSCPQARRSSTCRVRQTSCEQDSKGISYPL
jgi:hypothetical protein